MQHSIQTEKLGPWSEAMSNAVQKCVHCGFCLPNCPTYQTMGEEMDSPRGRIFLMKEALEGQIEIQDTTTYIDRCLGCLSCETSCPSGVPYGELLTPYRAMAESQRKRTIVERLFRSSILRTLPFPRRFRLAMKLGALAKPLANLLPGKIQSALKLIPATLPTPSPLPEIYPAEGECRARVALLSGCAQTVLSPDINWATLRVLAKNGVETYIPTAQVCCGALAAHTGAMSQAKQFAKTNLHAFPVDVDAIVTNAAGCGSGMHEYGLWLADEPEEEKAKAFSKRVCDVSVFLSKLGIQPPPPLPNTVRLAYHDACHLAHAQRVKQEPRNLLRAIENLEIAEIPSGELCCGSAGTYNMEQPESAEKLGEAKADAIASTNPQVVASGNIGCLMQIQTHLAAKDINVPILHTMQVLDRAYRSEAF